MATVPASSTALESQKGSATDVRTPSARERAKKGWGWGFATRAQHADRDR
ncbi:MAG: hypothetical protein QOF16_1688 [Actinomycetota bacterium]|jgi:hypothetical protein|nr:hypothetical protein [Actinomycetota bacterium]